MLYNVVLVSAVMTKYISYLYSCIHLSWAPPRIPSTPTTILAFLKLTYADNYFVNELGNYCRDFSEQNVDLY